MTRNNFLSLIAALPLTVAGPIGATAQDIAFVPEPTESCLAAAEGMPDRLACIGRAAQVCIDTPDGYTTVGMGFCYSREADYWDDRLNGAFARLMSVERAMLDEMREIGATVPDAPAALRGMQRAWIGYRDALCGYDYTTWGGGTGGGPAFAACLMQETGRQTLLLETRLEERQR